VLEPRRITVTRHRIGSGARPLRVVQLTDLHLQELGEFEEDVAATAMSLAPDIILFTGDSIDRCDRAGVFDAFLARLGAGVPKYAVLGNWDRWSRVPPDEWRRLYERHGCRLLLNETVTVEHPGGALHLTGVDDLVAGMPRLTDDAAALNGAPHLLLSHCPAYRAQVAALAPRRFTAMLSGHTHGGQVRVLGFAPVLPRGSGGYVSGWYRDEAMPPLYVSRGIGTSGIHARFFAPPEIALFEIG
jgi:uncharacterized protein